ncbi:integrating conjugative element protein [Yersinia pseudotuberculosis]|uniref:integrating conjugative element protein n=1 Tax=Yersinia pseudotuberculosis complex TaxID=1649845 RepID=UPI00119F5956|nr:integrating conjugative element protein [Yersinia similis]
MRFLVVLLQITFVTALSFSAISWAAELTVVADLGGESTTAYFDSINNQEVVSTIVLPSAPLSVSAMLPINTPELTPGKVDAMTLNLVGISPIFIIGDDESSRRWLALRLNTLVQLNAVGLVVNITREEAFNDLKEHAEGLTLLPVSGSDLAKRLGLSHYPVLLTEKGVEQ